MNHIIKFSNCYNFYGFSFKYYEVPFHKCCLSHQQFSNKKDIKYASYETAISKKVVPEKPGKGCSRLKKTDLLKVTKSQATQERMIVAKLKASQIAAFANEPGMVFSNQEDKNRTHLNEEIANYNEKKSSSIKEKGAINFEKKSALHPMAASNLDLYYQVMNSKLAYSANDEFMSAYFDVCINNGLLEAAKKILYLPKNEKLTFPRIYETFIRKYSENEDFFKVEDIMTLMEKRQVKLTSSTLAIYLDCLYRSDVVHEEKMTKIKKVLTNFIFSGGKLKEILNGSKTVRKKNILHAVRWIYPNFKDVTSDAEPIPNFPLVKRLYEDANFIVSPSHPKMNEREFIKLAVEQINLEKSIYLEIKSVFPRWNSKFKNKAKTWNELADIWREKLRQNLILNLEAVKMEFDKSKSLNLYPFLTCLSVDEMVEIMMREIQFLCAASDKFSLSSSCIYRGLGEKISDRYDLKKKYEEPDYIEKYKSFLSKYFKWYKNPNLPSQNYRQKWQSLVLEHDEISTSNEKCLDWTGDLKKSLGKFIFQIIWKSTIIPANFLTRFQKFNAPGFYLLTRHLSERKTVEQVKAHPILVRIFRRDNSDKLLFEVKNLPMICPPKPWTSVKNGGLYTLPQRLLRYTSFDYNTKILSEMPNTNLFALFDSLNQLQSVAWVLNCKILDIVIKVFKEGGSEELNVPINPDLTPFSKSTKLLFYERRKLLQEKRELYSLWCECLYKLSLANHFRNKVFWLPYNIDFRGRVYPIPPHVSHICADLYRSLYVFAKKKPLGPKGLDWLKIHCINLYGTHKKKSLSDRLKYANEMLPEILDSAEKPLNGRRWWSKAEDPWQTLAACMEISNALKTDNPEIYETGFPVHQDGSCNGLQHYAALGRDPVGAASVNLASSETPQDIYEVVVNIIEGMRKRDAQKGVRIAKVLEGYVIRKVVKQTVMTTVYGVTYFGAKTQIASKLRDFKEFPPEYESLASIYLTTKVFAALNEMFTSAREIQCWFLRCARIITSKLQRCVTWITPLGLPVSQPYFKKANKNVQFGNFLPEGRKQGNAFPPNFIHSLDSSHMMLTALSCGKQDITFASIHDCYWTHPLDIDRMNVICRSKFIELHSENILDDLAEHFLEIHKNENVAENTKKTANEIFKSLPEKGKFDLNEVANSTYFFS